MDSLDFVLMMKNLKDTNFVISDLFLLTRQWVEQQGFTFRGVMDITKSGVVYSIYKPGSNPEFYLQGRDFVSFDVLFNFIQGDNND